MRSVDGIRGLKDLFVNAITGGTTTVEEMHAAIARRSFQALERMPVTRISATAVRMVHNGIAGHRLERNQNGLRISMEFRHERRTVVLSTETLRRTYPGATGKLVVFV